MNHCSYCGEYKEGRFEEDLESLRNRAGSLGFRFVEFICKDCDKALKIKNNRKLIEQRKEKERKQKEWIKERDNILKSKEVKNETSRGKGFS